MSHFDTITARARRLRRHRLDRRHAGGRVRGARAAASTACSSTPRSCTRRTARRCSSTSSTTSCGCRPDVDDDVDHRDRRSRPIRAQVGDGPGHLRPVGRRRLGGGRRPRAQGGRPAAHVRVRRHRPDAPGRGRAGGRDVPPPPGHRADPRAGRRPLLRAARRASSTPRRSARPSASCSSASSRRPPAASRTPASSCRARSTPTSSSRATATTRPRSRATTTSAGCPRTWTSSWSSRCAACSRTRCAGSARSSACPTRSCGASRSPGPGLGVRIIGEVTPEKVAILQHADAIVREEIKPAGLEREIWQAFAVLPDIRSVGRDGRRAHLRPPDHHPGRHQRGRHDRRLGPPALRPARAHVEPHHQRGRRASTGWPTTSRRSRPAPSSGSDRRRSEAGLLG